jgi:hypothetical protein
MTFFDAGPLGDPLIRGRDELGEICIGHYPAGQIAAAPFDHAPQDTQFRHNS